MDVHALMIRAMIGPLWAKWEGSHYLRHCRVLRRRQYDRPEAIQKRQWQALQAMILHAWDTVPFYQRRWRQAGLPPDKIRSWADYRQLPVLTKNDILAHGSSLVSTDYRLESLHRKRTSGSTGVPLTP